MNEAIAAATTAEEARDLAVRERDLARAELAKTTSIKMFAVDLQPHSTTSLSFPMSVTTNPGGVQINVTTTKVTMDNAPRVQIGSGTIGNEFSTSATVFDEESYLMVEIATASVLDGVLGGWVQIEPV
jgi:hypothetical protein